MLKTLFLVLLVGCSTSSTPAPAPAVQERPVQSPFGSWNETLTQRLQQLCVLDATRTGIFSTEPGDTIVSCHRGQPFSEGYFTFWVSFGPAVSHMELTFTVRHADEDTAAGALVSALVVPWVRQASPEQLRVLMNSGHLQRVTGSPYDWDVSGYRESADDVDVLHLSVDWNPGRPSKKH